MMERDRRAVEQFDRSALLSALATAGGRLSVSVEQSRIVGAVRARRHEFSALSLAVRIRAVATLVFAATLTHEALATITPAQSASAVTAALPIALALAAAIVIAAAPQFATAWEARRT
jgi:hypothetical protein